MKNKKGFTLIELLAVIVILAIIALIATPIILNMINDARKSAAVDSAYGYIESIEYANSMNMLNSDKYPKIESGNVTSINPKVNLKGTKPTSGDVTVDSTGRITNATLCINGYNISYNGQKATATDTKCGDSSEEKEEVLTGPTSEDPDKTTTKGLVKIVYLDPTDLTKTCTSADAATNLNNNGTPTEIITGCMKWYAYKDDGTNYLMILDHNIAGMISWRESGSEKTGMDDVAELLKLKTTSWDQKLSLSGTIDGFDYTGYKARLITADEVAEITGADKTLQWKSSQNYTSSAPEFGSTISDFYLDGAEGTDTTWKTKVADTTIKSKYAWLYDYTSHYTNSCKMYGCNFDDLNKYSYYENLAEVGQENIMGYWTSTAVSNNSSGAYRVNAQGFLEYRYIGNKHDAGVRPVIKVQKSLIRE